MHHVKKRLKKNHRILKRIKYAEAVEANRHVYYLRITTIILLAITLILILSEHLIHLTDSFHNFLVMLEYVTLGFLAVEIMIEYFKYENKMQFLKKHWFSLILFIPFARIFRATRATQLLRFGIEAEKIAPLAKTAGKFTQHSLELMESMK